MTFSKLFEAKVALDPEEEYRRLFNRVPKKYRKLVIQLIERRARGAFNNGYNDGMAREKENQKKSKEQFRVDLSMSIQKLADSNAQIATCLVNALGKLA